ncbi:beta-mannosidase [Porphyromonas pogonae]|uniref:beta-mannosidase n=1 Tax=Porphyromonas pogonae TaxID=867595 RepID=UPI002E796384|nr:glycoside hydrolase family 2 protein [Porphyromonas pogonae]
MILQCSAFSRNTETDTLNLNKDWTFSETGKDRWYDATVPGVVQQDLIRHKLLPDPNYRLAEDSIQWVGERDWTYKCNFSLNRNQLLWAAAYLSPEGLDTYAEVFLNGQKVLTTANMFVGYKVDVKHLLQAENTLEIRFTSPLKAAIPAYEREGINYPADNDHAPVKLSVFTRKAPYHYGWDWGQRMITIGIWRPVKLLFMGKAAFESKPSVTYSLKGGTDDYIEVHAPLRNNGQKGNNATLLTYRLIDPDGNQVFQGEQPFELSQDTMNVSIKHALPQVKRWMPNGWGKPNLYTMDVKLMDADKKTVLDQAAIKIGFRTVELIREDDSHGKSFYFKVNGKPLFAKGANYIPGTLMLPARTDEELSQLFDDVQKSHMNMLRVWGGGVYESDRFYDLADERGILIWQDFMFACTPYPSDDDFLDNVRTEVDYNINRLKGHPSVAVWCGNNEINEALKYWGWQKKYSEAEYKHFLDGYDKLFGRLIPDRINLLDPSRQYIESSPDTANWGRPNTLSLGESHYWGVWYGREPFNILRTRMPRFMSEFGVQSFPMISSISKFALPQDYDLESAVMKNHQKSSIGNEVIMEYISRDYKKPEDFRRFVYLSQVMQGEGISLGIEAQRAANPRCMGSLYWQLNDAWPAVSWSSIDFYGKWKALQYHAAKAFAPVVITVDSTGGKVRVVSDLDHTIESVRLSAKPIDFKGKQYEAIMTRPFNIAANKAGSLINMPIERLLPKSVSHDWALLYELKTPDGNVIAEKLVYAHPPKELNLPPNPNIIIEKQKISDREYKVRVSCDVLVRQIYLEADGVGGHFSDNFFDLVPGRVYELSLTPRVGYSLSPDPQISIEHL